MRRLLTNRRRTDQRGAVAVIVAVAMSSLLIAGGIVLDFGVVRMDRQMNKLAADDAVTAGLRAADGGTGEVYTDLAVCGALDYLKANRSRLSGLPAGLCAAPDPQKACAPGDSTTASSYYGTTSSGGTSFEVWIKSPYSVTDTSTGGGFPEEALGTLASDQGDAAKSGCDQVGVIVKELTPPGLGRLVTSTPIASRIRSVGRVATGNGDIAPALLLLERTKCSVLTVGSGGAPSAIRVYGSGTTPGSIHADSSGTGAGCGSGSNQQLFQGKQADGLVAYGAGGVPGSITSYAGLKGVPNGTVYDSPANVYGTTAANELATGVKSPPTGRAQVTRKPVDVRYRTGVASAIASATSVWSLNSTTPGGIWQRVGCNPTATVMSALTPAQGLYIDCPGASGITLSGTINAGKVFFNGWWAGGVLSMPNATAVYVNNPGAKSSGIALSNGDAFCVGSATCNPATPTTNPCPSAPTTSKAQLLVRDGSLKQAGGLLKLCNTTAIFLGGDTAKGCVPTTNGTPPTAIPCAGGTGTAQMQINGGYQDWTAPNQYGGPIPPASQAAAWSGGEDLALWDESYGGSSNPTFNMAGGGNTHTVGVFMAPNANPFNISGGGTQNLVNAQYIATSFSLNGGANLTMTVDPANAVPLPALGPFTMVR